MNHALQNKIALDYWLDRLAGIEHTGISIPTAARINPAHGRQSFKMKENSANALKKICNQHDAGIYAYLLTALQILMHKYTADTGILIAAAAPVLSGETPGEAPLFFPAAIQHNTTVKDLLLAFQKDVKDAYHHKQYDVEKLIEKYQSLYGTADTLIQFGLSYSPFTGVNSYLQQAPLSFAVQRTPQSFEIEIHYAGSYADWLITQLGQHYLNVLAFVTDHPAATIQEIPLLSAEEKTTVLETFNDTTVDFPDKNESIIRLFEKQVKAAPEQIAVQYKDTQLSYQTLHQRALQLSSQLRGKGTGPQQIVALVCDRSEHMITGMLGTLKAGAAYLPIDADFPDDRIQYMLQDSGAAVVLTTKNILAEKQACLQSYNDRLILLDEMKETADLTDFTADNAPDDPAYIIYTSGSTGQPKGVVVRQDGFTNFVLAYRRVFKKPLDTTDRVQALSNISFDASIAEIFVALTSGATLVVLEKEQLFDPARLAGFMVQQGITYAYIPPVLLKDLYSSLQQYAGNIPLRKLFVGVEAIKDTVLYGYCELIKELEVINAYGPTETTVITSILNYEPETPVGNNVSIGKPIANYKVYILDDNLQPVPPGVAGELCIAGAGVTKGYLNNEDLTAAKFIGNPFEKGKQMYRSGDLAHWTADGNIIFIGRKDNQMKIRGYRIELGEIESAMHNYPGIKAAVVAAFEDDRSGKYLCAYYVPDAAINVSDLRAHLSRTLPEYMVPSVFISLDKIPVTSNGKTDRKKLPRPEKAERTLTAADQPANELEEKLLAIWKELLNIPQFGVNDNFFELGGHSLKAARLIAMIHQAMKVEVPLRQVFASGTIRNLAAYIQTAEKTAFEILPATAAAYYPATASQRSVYLSYLLHKEATNYNMPTAYTLEGTLDLDRLESAFRAIIERQEAFRTFFSVIDGQVVQHIADKVPFELIRMSGDEQQYRNFVAPFDLTKAPLLRVACIQQEKENILLFDTHHIISDGISVGLLLKEIMQHYHAAAPAPLKLQYKDYAVWLNQYKATKDYTAQKQYWLSVYEEKPETAALPIDFPRPDEPGTEGENLFFPVDKEMAARMKKLVTAEKSTLFLLSFAAYKILLSKYAGQEDIVVGTPVAGRIHPDLDNIIGMFVNTLPLRTRLQPEQRFPELLQQLKNNFFLALENQLYPFDELIQDLDIKRTAGRNPLFDSLFVYQNIDATALNLQGLSVQPRALENPTAKFDLCVEVHETGETMTVLFNYAKELFRKSTIEQMARHYMNILKTVLENPQQSIAAISLLDKAEKTRIAGFNQAATPQRPGTLHQLFEAQASRTPDAIAVSCKGTTLTYAALNTASDQLAASFIRQGVTPGAVVAVIADRNEKLIISLLAILKAGAVYLPVDPKHPADRIAFMLEDSGCRHALATGSMTTAVADQLLQNKVQLLAIEIPANITIPVFPAADAKNRAYILYTSGSTGKPKGVVIEQGSIVNYISWAADYYYKGRQMAMPLYTSVSFDLTLTSIFTPLLTGSEVVVYGEEEDGLLIETIITDNKVDVIKLTPAHLKIIRTLNTLPAPDVNRVKAFIVGGEALDSQLAKDIHEKYQGTVAILNEYGPTEATVGCMIYQYNPQDDQVSVPIGVPIDNTRIYILDKAGQLCPVGVMGELCVGGTGLAAGYLNRPELTAEKFTQVAVLGQERIYKTGDLAKWLPDGNVIFGGRKDEQLKINGYRIEPGEIEAALLAYDAITEAVILAIEDKRGDKSLVAYFSAAQPVDIAVLKAFLLGRVPAYMLPAYFVEVPVFPLTTNGKLDKKALPKPDTGISRIPVVAPANTQETTLLAIWKDVLETEEIGVTHNFFESGGHSLKAMILVSRIQKEFDADISLKDIFRNPTVKELSLRISKAGNQRFKAIEPVTKQEYYPLSSAQKRIFVLSHFSGAETSYNMYGAFWIEGRLDVARLEAAFQQLLDRHESLRTAFTIIDDEPVQIIREGLIFDLKRHKAPAAAAQAIVEGFIRKFDLENPPMFRAEILEAAPDKHLLMYDVHHIVGDGMSMRTFMQEVMDLYEGRQLTELRIQYKDYAAWQHALFTSGAMDAQKQYWKTQFEGTLPVLELPIDFPRPMNQTFEGSNYMVGLDADLAARITAFVHKKGVTLNMFFLTVYNILLSKYSSSEDIIVGTAVAGRSHADLQPLIGMFVNTLALRNFPKAEKRFGAFLEEVKEYALTAYENPDYPFEELVDSLNLKRDTSRNPLIDTMFLYATDVAPKEEPGEWNIVPYNMPGTIAKLDLILEAAQLADGIKFLLNYNTNLFKEATIKRLVGHYLHIIEQVLVQPEITLGNIVLPGEEEKQLLREFGGTPEAYAPDLSIPMCWKEQAAKYPDEPAIITTAGSLTFREMDEQSDALAAHLINHYAVKKGDKVAVMQHRSKELMVSLLAILKTGAAYVPVDPNFPAQRISYILTNSESRLILTDKEHADMGLPVLNIQREKIAAATLPPIAIGGADLAYVIYTSGSTGTPKGVMMEHGNVVSLSENLEPFFGIKPNDRLLALANVTFDMSILDLLCSFVHGVCIVVASDEEVNDFEKVAALIREQRITVMQSTPSRLSMLYDIAGNDWINGIKALLVGGEAMTEKLFRLLRKAKHTRVFNTYGPTETCVWSTAEEIKDDKINIGHPLKGEQILILNTAGVLQPVNVAGEICIAGSGVGRGYSGNETLTAEKFIRNERLSPGVIYRTGDSGKWLPDGRIEYIGRLDNQVKLRGYRIELGEIENALCRMEGVEIAGAIITDINGDKQIALFYEADREYSYSTVRSFLAERLPSYMLPLLCVYLEKMPFTTSGKIDRITLEKLAQQQQTADRPFEEPSGTHQKTLAAIWREILQRDAISASDNFFEIGGNSIKLIQVLNKVKKALGVTVPLATAFTYPTIKELSAKIKMIAEFGNVSAEDFYSVVNPGKEKMIYCFPPAIGYSFVYTALAEYLPDYSICCFHFIEEGNRAEQYLKVINELGYQEPLLLLGYSAGGNFAFEMAQSFEAAGKKVADIILIDTYKRWKSAPKTTEEMDETIRAYFESVDWSLFTVEPDYLEGIKQTTLSKISAYCRHMDGRTDNGTTDARIHILRSIEEWDKDEINRFWEESTTTDCHTYQGGGIHMEMLNPEYLSQNAGIIAGLLQQPVTKKGNRKEVAGKL